MPQGGLWSPEVVAARGGEGVCGEGVWLLAQGGGGWFGASSGKIQMSRPVSAERISLGTACLLTSAWAESALCVSDIYFEL